MPLECYEDLLKRKDDPKFQDKSAKSSTNRKKGGKDGKAPPTHVLGRQSAARAFIKLGVSATPYQLFLVSKKKGDKFINPRSEEVDAEYERMKAMLDAGEITIDEFEMYLKAVGGFNKKKRLFGIGGLARELFTPPSSSTPRDDDSYTPSLIAHYAMTNSQLQEQVKELQKQREADVSETHALKARLAKELGWSFDETCNTGPTPHRRDDFSDDGHGFVSQDLEALG